MLKSDDRLFQEVVRSLLNGHFPPSMHQDLLDELSLGDLVSLRREKRDASFRGLVVQAYEHRCAVCGYDIRIGSSALALEAAHIKWRQAGGPDQVSNGLALCAVHHKALDRGAIGITCDYDIVISGELYGYAWAQELFLNYHRKKLRSPHSRNLIPDQSFLAWHQREVFRGPARQ